MKPLRVSVALGLCVSAAALAAPPAKNLDYPEAVHWLATTLTGLTLDYFGHTPGKLTLGFETGDNGAVVLRQTVERENPDFGFRSTTEQSWHFYLGDLDRKSVEARFDPPSVFAATKGKLAEFPRRIRVERSERKTAAQYAVDASEQWAEQDRFTTSFITIPVRDAAMADQVAEVLRRAVKKAPEPEI